MNGLRYVREKYKMSITDLAEKLGISRQAVSIWEQSKKPIPEKRLEELSTIFSIPKEYFAEISDIQELEIEKHMLDQEIVKSEHDVEMTYEDADGSVQHVTLTEPDSALVAYSQYNDSQISKRKLLNKIDSIISGEPHKAIISIYEEMEHIDTYVKLYDRFSDIVTVYWLRGMMFKIIRALEVSLDINKKKNGIIGESRELYGWISDEDEFVQKLIKLIAKEYNKQQKERNADRELIELWSNNADYDDLY